MKFIFENWPVEYKYLKQEVMDARFEDILCFCIRNKMKYKDMQNLFEKTLIRIMEKKFPHMTQQEKADELGMDCRKYRSFKYKHKRG